MDLPSLDKERVKKRSKAVTISGGIKYLEAELAFVEACISYRHSENDFGRLKQVIIDGSAVQVPSFTVLEALEHQLRELLKITVDVKAHGWGSGKWSPNDFSYANYNWRPENVLKQNGTYDRNGYPIYSKLFLYLKGKLHQFTPQGDEYGFYFQSDQYKVYYYQFKEDYANMQLSDDEPTPSTSHSTQAAPPKKSVKKSVKKQRPAKGAPTEKGASNTVVTKGHGLQLLLAQAKDPPGVEISGHYEKLKGFRRRTLAKNLKCKDLSSLFKWRDGKWCFIILFDTESAASAFGATVPTQLNWRHCNFK